MQRGIIFEEEKLSQNGCQTGRLYCKGVSFSLEFLLVQSHFLGCFYRFLPACVESVRHPGVTRGHVGRGLLLLRVHRSHMHDNVVVQNPLKPPSHGKPPFNQEHVNPETEQVGLGMSLKRLHLTNPLISSYFYVPLLLPHISTPALQINKVGVGFVEVQSLPPTLVEPALISTQVSRGTGGTGLNKGRGTFMV